IVEVPPGKMAKLAMKLRGFGTIAGVVLDETTRAPVPGLTCGNLPLSKDGDAAWVYGMETAARGVTDGSGSFKIERAPAGDNSVTCYSEGYRASDQVEVVAGESSRVELHAHARAPDRPVQVGMELEDQLGEVIVKSVAA